MANNSTKMHQNESANVRREENTSTPTTPRSYSSTTSATSPRSGAEGSSTQPGSAGKNTKYRGARSRNGKWVSEIREPRKSTRIWLGTYNTPEMAAAAYDVAALALKGPDATLNFPNSILSYPIPISTSASDIRAAAASAAMMKRGRVEEETTSTDETTCRKCSDDEFIDEEALLNMPSLLVNMAEGMLMTPPRIQSKSSSSDESGGDGGGDGGLWSYT